MRRDFHCRIQVDLRAGLVMFKCFRRRTQDITIRGSRSCRNNRFGCIGHVYRVPFFQGNGSKRGLRLEEAGIQAHSFAPLCLRLPGVAGRIEG